MLKTTSQFDQASKRQGLIERSRLGRQQFDQQAKDAYWQNALASGGATSGITAPSASPGIQDPGFDAMFQGLQEAGVDKLADNSVGVARGQWEGPGYDAVDLQGPMPMARGPLQGIRSVTSGKPARSARPDMGPGYQSHEQFMQSLKKR